MDQLELFALHSLDHGLILNALLLLGECLVFNLLLGTHLSLEEVALALVLRLFLLALYHLLQLMVLYLLLVLLHLHEILLLSLLMFEIVHVAADLLLIVPLRGINVRTDTVFKLTISFLAHGLFLFSLALALCSLGSDLHVTLAGA